jgi:NADP-dependent 3-hydroxy acid dehydrogenase YdfG
VSSNGVSVITGASSGIGAELAALHARQGWEVVMVNRSLDGRLRPRVSRDCIHLG